MTGTFDNWSKSTLLNKLGTIHEKSLAFPKIDEKIYYKVCTCAFAFIPCARVTPACSKFNAACTPHR